ncbi:hypothetical protein C2E23DRAFT_891022 [Lenzites betulinus]|nr:hypothetical protein C2E23DRAFT_891022 [Lenzites betulinus]
MTQGPPVLAIPMSTTQDNMHTDYYVVLDHNGDEGIFIGARPPNVAVRRHDDLLHIVVATHSWREATKINGLNTEIVAQLSDPVDANHFKELILASTTVRSVFADAINQPIYALRVARETGIYLGYNWTHDLKPLVLRFRGATYKKFYVFEEALLWMLYKNTDHALFTSPASVPPPPPYTPAPIANVQPASDAGVAALPPTVDPMSSGGRSAEAIPPATAPPTPDVAMSLMPALYDAGAPAAPSIALEVPATRAPLLEAVSSLAESLASGLAIEEPRRADLRDRLTEHIAGHASDAVAYADSFGRDVDVVSLLVGPLSTGGRVATMPPADTSACVSVEATVPAARSSHAIDDHEAAANRPHAAIVDHLRRVIRPVPPPQEMPVIVDMGNEVKVWIRAHRIPVELQLYLLQAYIWAEDVSEFVATTGRPPLELPVIDAEHVWGLISTQVALL